MRRPAVVGFPRIRSSFESLDGPGKRLSLTVQVVAKKRRFDGFAECHGCLVIAKGNQAERRPFFPPPPAMVPRACDHEIVVLRVIAGQTGIDFPWPPGVFLVP